MKYMGSKRRHAKEILPIILKQRHVDQYYVEPFVGGANMIDKVTGNRIGADIQPYLIALLKGLAMGWTPPTSLSEIEYSAIRENKGAYPPELVGFVGFPCSYAAKWFGGYCRGFTSKGKPRDYIMEAWRNVEKQKSLLKGIDFLCVNYQDLIIPEDSIIYCDPPYSGTTKYGNSFDHKAFWEWCREKHKGGHVIFISEYTSPEDFRCVWEKTVTSSLTRNTGAKKGTEKLFSYAGGL